MICSALLLCWSVALSAAAPNKVEQQRKLFYQAYIAVQQGRIEQSDTLAKQLSDYPLYPYLRYKQLAYALKHDPGEHTDQQVRQFIKKYSDVPIVRHTRKNWLQHLAQRREWRSYIHAYRPDLGVTYDCWYLRAQIQLEDDHKKVLPNASKLWLHPHSQPKSCDPVFSWLQRQGHLKHQMIERRMHLSMEAGDISMVRYLSSQLGTAAKTHADLWITFHQKPRDSIQSAVQSAQITVPLDVIVHGLNRLARRSPAEAASAWKKLEKKTTWPLEFKNEIQRSIAYRMALSRLPEALDWFAQIPENAYQTSTWEWRGRAALFWGQWDQALMAMNALENQPDPTELSLSHQYWKARALKETRNQKHADKIYRSILSLSNKNESEYYRFLAADRISETYKVQLLSFQSTPDLRLRLLKTPAILRVKELYALEFLPWARVEWRLLLKGLSDDEQREAAILASEWHWHSESVIAAVRSNQTERWALRYPLAHSNEVKRWSSSRAILEPWVYSIMRSESLFITDIRSHAGAIGLLQLMPATAKMMAKQDKIRLSNHSMQLTQPDLNIRLGTAYMDKMHHRFHDNLVLATAAYNAGPGNVKKWLPPTAMPADIWIENIPFNETRSYVKRVLMTIPKFEWRLSGKSSAISLHMPSIDTQARKPPHG